MNAFAMKATAIACCVLAAAMWVRAEPVTYTLSGQVSYEGSSPMGIWHGTNTTMSGNLVWDKQTGSATGAVCVTVGSWTTGNSARDDHSKTMFEADRFPKACFTFVRIENKKLTGTLNLHGVKLPLVIPGELREDRGRLQFNADMVMKLNDWKLVRPSLLGAEVANEVKVHIHGEGTAK